MSFRKNILVLVGFFLAFTLSLPLLSMGAGEYPPAIGPQSAISSSDSTYTVYALVYSEELDYRGDADEEFEVPESWRWITLMFSNNLQEVTLKHCNWDIIGYGEDEDGNYVAYTDYPDVLKKGEKYKLEIFWELKLYHDRKLPEFSLEDSGMFDDISPELVEEYTKTEGVWKNAMRDEQIRETAFNLRNPNVLQTLYNIIEWMGNNITYKSRGIYPEEVYYTREGECDDVSRLIVAFCRILGIPAYLEVGFGMEKWADVKASLYDGHLHILQQNYYPNAWAKVYVPNIGWLPVDWVASYEPGAGGPKTAKGAITQADILKSNFCIYYIVTHSDHMKERKEILLGYVEGMERTLYDQEMYLDVSVWLIRTK